MLTIFSIHQSHDGLFWITLDFPMQWQSSISLWEIWMSATLNTSVTLKIFILDIVRNPSYFNIISSIVLLHGIRRCFKNYDFCIVSLQQFPSIERFHPEVFWCFSYWWLNPVSHENFQPNLLYCKLKVIFFIPKKVKKTIYGCLANCCQSKLFFARFCKGDWGTGNLPCTGKNNADGGR